VPSQQPSSRWKWAAVAALALFVGSVLPSPLPRRPEFSRFGPDKFFHFVGHAALAATFADALATDSSDALWTGGVVVVGSSLYSLVLGHLQQYVPGRAPERADTVAGVIGSIAGVAGWWHSRNVSAEAGERTRPTETA
jgi:VanZ family protein